jgi:SAM-dependent methyltransferase
MRVLDRLLQRWRARLARPWIPAGARVLDIGCHHGEFLRSLRGRIGPSVGLDPRAPAEVGPGYRLLAEPLRPPAPFADGAFDAIVLLATLEHLCNKEAVARECYRLVRPGGRVIVTVPSPRVDRIVAWLCRLRLADGMALEEHHGFDPVAVPGIFGRHGLVLEHQVRFQLGLNHLYVFGKPGAARPAPEQETSCATRRHWSASLR